MLCLSPATFNGGKDTAACGQCVSCRVNHKLRWMGRMALERRYACPGMSGSFITLTYAPEHLPPGGTLVREHLTNFIRQLKRELGPAERYFAVGEYGSKGLRPHYHVIHFGAHVKDPAAWKRVYEKCWPYGLIDVGEAESGSFNYVAGYVTKKLDNGHAEEIELRQLLPEFFSCSLKPTLGSSGLVQIARALNTAQGAAALAQHGFPRGFNLEGRYYPFFRRDRLRVIEMAGYDRNISEDHLQSVNQRSWFYVEEMEIFRQAEVFAWPSAKLFLRLQALREDQHGEATAEEIKKAQQRAAKWRRRQAAQVRRLDS